MKKHRFRVRIAELQTITWCLDSYVIRNEKERELITWCREKWRREFNTRSYYKSTPMTFISINIDGEEEFRIIYQALANKDIRYCPCLPGLPYGKYYEGSTHCSNDNARCPYIYKNNKLGFQTCYPIIMKTLRDRVNKLYNQWYKKEETK